MPLLLLGLGLWFFSALLGSMALQLGQAQSIDSQTRAVATRFVASSIQHQIMDAGSPPTSLGVAAAKPGYEDLRLEAGRPWQNYAVSPVMVDGTWQFQRAVVFSQKQSNAVDAASYLAANACGPGDFASPGPWCGGKDSHWWLYDSRHDYSNEISLEKSAQRRILQKFAHAYTLVVDNRQAFPKPIGASSTLAALVGYGGPPGACVGAFVWNSIPLDCTDLFSVWGTPRVYNYLTEDYIALFTSSTIKDAGGNRVPVASQLDARNRLLAK